MQLKGCPPFGAVTGRSTSPSLAGHYPRTRPIVLKLRFGAGLVRIRMRLTATSLRGEDLAVSSKIPDPEGGMEEAVKYLGWTPPTIRAKCERDEIEHTRDPATGRYRFKFSTLIRILEEREKENTRRAKERRKAMDARQRAERQA